MSPRSEPVVPALHAAQRAGLLRRAAPRTGHMVWLIGMGSAGATVSSEGIRRRNEVLSWGAVERLELIVEPPPFKHWWSWVLANLLGVALGSYEARHGHVRMQVLKRGVAFQETWDLGRTPQTYDEVAARELASWVAQLVTSQSRTAMLRSGC